MENLSTGIICSVAAGLNTCLVVTLTLHNNNSCQLQFLVQFKNGSEKVSSKVVDDLA